MFLNTVNAQLAYEQIMMTNSMIRKRTDNTPCPAPQFLNQKELLLPSMLVHKTFVLVS